MSPDSVPIPREFQSVYKDGLFETCFGCECSLLEGATPYAVAKNIVGTEPIFEMAVCFPCVSSLQSQETQRRITEFIRSLNLQPPANPEQYTWEDGLRQCLICAKPRAACRRYQILGVCLQRDLLVAAPPTPSPYLICEDCNEALSKLLSQETKDNWDRFIQERTDDPPGVSEDSPRFDPVFV